ncbi:MAG: hypothetical protein AB1485_01590 [Candidatus Thermoplasmatota archaeon]
MVNEEAFSIENETEKIISRLRRLKGKDCVIAEIDEIHSFRLEIELIDILTRVYKMRGVAICVSRPALYLQRVLASRNVTADELYFIDTIKCISGAMNEEEVSKWLRNTSLLGSPFDLDAIIKTLRATVEKLKGSEHFIILDSIVPIVLYWDDSKIEAFLKLLKELPKEYGSNVIITIPKTCKGVS